ncbi:MAG: MFS transporter [Acidimicrobiia bacterium]|nr:MFS transporter [Acidimicrobiia bacterium]
MRGRVDSFGTFESLKIPLFRDFFVSMLGQMASQNMQMVVRSYIAYLLTGSYAALGTIALASAVPGIVFAMVGGAIADRVARRKLVVQAGQVINGLNALGVGLLLFTDSLTFGLLLVSAVVQGTSMALMMPSRQALLPSLVPSEQLMNAVALNSAGMNTMRLFAPALGGYIFEWAGAAWVYFLMCGLYLFASLFLLRVPEVRRDTVAAGSIRGEMRAGFGNIWAGITYIVRSPIMGPLMGINILVVITAMPYMFLLGGFVQDVFDSGADSLGLLQSISGIGALSGALVIASLPPRRRGAMYLVGSAFQGLMLFIAFTFSTSVWMMAGFLLFMGVGQSARQSLSNVLIQSYVEDEYRGRVMSVYMLQFSLSQLGAFLTGILAAAIGPRAALGATSLALVVLALGALVFVPRLRNLD